LVAISGVCHAIQSASYETQRQEYEYLGWGKKPQEPPPRNSPERGRDGPAVIRWLFDFLHRLFFVGLSFPTAGITRKFRASMAAVLQSDSATAASSVSNTVRRSRRKFAAGPSVANYRTLGYSFPPSSSTEYYFAFEIIGFSLV